MVSVTLKGSHLPSQVQAMIYNCANRVITVSLTLAKTWFSDRHGVLDKKALKRAKLHNGAHHE